ncbi:hypothetical protein D3C72_1381250 [compost metagenome]
MSRTGASRSRSLTDAGRGADGSILQTPTIATIPSAVTNQSVVLQLPNPPIKVPIGEPRAVAPVRPAVTVASARPRFSGAASAEATPNAVGENSAAPNPARARLTRTQCKSVASALIALPTTKMPSAETSRSLRGKPPATAAITGAATA